MGRRRNSWIKLGLEAMVLSIEAVSVIGLRAAKIAAGGHSADAESKLMVKEKIDAAAALQTRALTGALGFNQPGVARKTLGHYRSRVWANQRRLLK